MIYTADELKRMFDRGYRVQAVRALRDQCGASLSDALHAFQDNTVELLLQTSGNKSAIILLTLAAPDLLAALKGVVRIADRKTVEFDAAREAIAKAEGKPELAVYGSLVKAEDR